MLFSLNSTPIPPPPPTLKKVFGFAKISGAFFKVGGCEPTQTSTRDPATAWNYQNLIKLVWLIRHYIVVQSLVINWYALEKHSP